MKKLLSSLLISTLAMGSGVNAKDIQNPNNNPISFPGDYYSNESLGCLLLQECTDSVVEVTSRKDIEDYYGETFNLPQEFEQILVELDKIGIKVFIAPESYFPTGHRGVYHTVSNNFYLNDAFMHRSHVLMSVLRHEGWHAVQDCMAGSLDNNFIAVIHNEDDIPQLWKDMARRTYPKHSLPWEQEASWAGRTENMTLNALKACSAGNMWETYQPTPLTRQFLVDKGFIKD